MPELPEVETIKRQLEKTLLGKKIKGLLKLDIKNSLSIKKMNKYLINRKITALDRIGKLLILRTDKSDVNLLIHLKMTGQLIWKGKKDTIAGGHTVKERDLIVPNQHTRAIIEFINGDVLYFNDMRRFGYIRLATENEVLKIANNYGIEPGKENFKLNDFFKLSKGKKVILKAFLLNQKYISGIGNIYADEICHQAKIHPAKKMDQLTLVQSKTIYNAIREIIARAIKARGTTFYSFLGSDGRKGDFGKQLAVFRRQGEPCRHCGNIIQKIRLAGRGTHYCPKCQKE